MKVRGIFKILFGSIIGFNLLILILVLVLEDNQEKQFTSQVNRINSFNFIIHLSESGVEMTEFCLNYVIRGDGIWVQHYWEIVDRRMGRLNSEAYRKSVLNIMQVMGFEQREFDLLSPALVHYNSFRL